MVKYFNINEAGCSIRCKIYFNNLKTAKRIVVCGHGFSGHKDNKAVEKFADFVLKKYKDIAVITYDEPCHGDDVKKKLFLNDCEAYIRIVTDYAKSKFGVDRIYGYATSFGGYQFLKYIAENGNPFYKTVLRCPAVNMYEVMLKMPSPEEINTLNSGKPILAGFDRKIRIDSHFLDELKNSDITTYDYTKYSDDILIMHGTKDEIVSFDRVEKFAVSNNIKFVPVEGADHRFIDPQKMDAAIKLIIEFFGF